jgi:prevent-host-death family protein
MHTQTVGAFEAKTHFSALLEIVEKGGEILITKHGKPVARLLPIGFSHNDFKQSIEKMKAFQSTHQIKLGLDWKILRDEGRP